MLPLALSENIAVESFLDLELPSQNVEEISRIISESHMACRASSTRRLILGFREPLSHSNRNA